MLRRRERLAVARLALTAALAISCRDAPRRRIEPAPLDGVIAGAAIVDVAPVAAVAMPAPSAVPASAVRCAAEPPLDVPARTIPPLAELVRTVREHPEKLGSASIGTPTRGSLWGGVALVESEGIHREGDNPWGTLLAVRSIERAVREVRRCHPDSPKLSTGDISRKRGGWLRPHASHQAGLDADLGYYYLDGSTWYQRATAKNLDVARTWTLVRALIEGGNVDSIFIDRGVQRILRAYVEKLPDEHAPLDTIFETDRMKPAVIRHAWGHATHLHVRFRDPASAELGARLQQAFPRPGTLPPAP